MLVIQSASRMRSGMADETSSLRFDQRMCARDAGATLSPERVLAKDRNPPAAADSER
jgi:hypothetical protein